jgi:hypothetical protein
VRTSEKAYSQKFAWPRYATYGCARIEFASLRYYPDFLIRLVGGGLPSVADKDGKRSSDGLICAGRRVSGQFTHLSFHDNRPPKV